MQRRHLSSCAANGSDPQLRDAAPAIAAPSAAAYLIWTMKRLSCIILSAAMLLALAPAAAAYYGGLAEAADIVFVVDVSGSVARDDGILYAKNALRLGVDLAPDNSRVAVIAVNTGVVSQTGLIHVGSSEGRNSLKEHIEQLVVQGSTNFIPGIELALELLQSSPVAKRRVILIGDFDEGGYNAEGRGSEPGAAAIVEELGRLAGSSGIAIDMVVWAEAPQGSVIGPSLLGLPGATAGTLFELADPDGVPACIEDIYFSAFHYRYTVLSVFGEGAQLLAVPLWTNNIRRARIYVSANTPTSAFGAAYAGDIAGGEQNRSYSMVDLADPKPGEVILSLVSGAAGTAKVYLLLDHAPLAILASVESEPAPTDGIDGFHGQTSVIHVDIVDMIKGVPLLADPHPGDVAYLLGVAAPDGRTFVEEIRSARASCSVSPSSPEEFGTYSVTAVLTAGGIAFGPFTTTVEIPDIRPVAEQSDTRLANPLFISIAVCCTLVLLSVVAFVRIRRRNAIYPGQPELASDRGFHGKLSIYGIIADGGDREISPFDYSLHEAGKKRLTLHEVFESAGLAGAYRGGGDILFLPGPEESIIVSNNSRAEIWAMGRSHGYRSRVQLFYGQKLHVVFEKDESELEIYYRQAKEGGDPPVRFNIGIRSAP